MKPNCRMDNFSCDSVKLASKFDTGIPAVRPLCCFVVGGRDVIYSFSVCLPCVEIKKMHVNKK